MPPAAAFDTIAGAASALNQLKPNTRPPPAIAVIFKKSRLLLLVSFVIGIKF
jgi:hypothetical protein